MKYITLVFKSTNLRLHILKRYFIAYSIITLNITKRLSFTLGTRLVGGETSKRRIDPVQLIQGALATSMDKLESG